MHTHEQLMKRALELAQKGWGMTNPNPLVGAVLVRDDRIVGEGWHRALGQPHAEIEAVRAAGDLARGSTLYVSLEPCSHTGRTPPCAKAIIEQGIAKVHIAMSDPNPKVSGRGIQMLRDAGIPVTCGLLEDQARKQNEIFIHYITCHKPWVVMKSAMTLDGKIAAYTGDSKWVSGQISRQLVHRLRSRMAAVLVGSQTVLNDNPRLNVRIDQLAGTNPLRVVVDSQGRTDPGSLVYEPDGQAMLATTTRLDPEREAAYLARGIRIEKLDGPDGRVDLFALIHKLYELEIDSVLVEGGGSLTAAMLEANLINKVMVFIAPKIIGGAKAPTPVEGRGFGRMAQAIQLRDIQVTQLDEDLLVEGVI